MKDLVNVLDDIKNTTVEMEYCEDFNKLQLIMKNSNQFVRSFDKIVFDSGNEPYIIEIVARLLKHFRIQNYLDKDNKVNNQYEAQLRKIMMYMVLNTDVSFRYDLSQDSQIGHLLNSFPQMSKCLLLNCIWGLDLDRFLYEMISNAPLWFSMQFLDQTIVSLKYGKPYEVLERVESIVRAIYIAICRTDCDWRKIDRNRYVDQQRTLSRMFEFVAGLLRHFNTPDVAKFERWSKLRKHRHFGFVLKHMFTMTSECLELYYQKPTTTVKPEFAVYELEYDRHVPREAGTEFSQATDNILTKINNCLLNTLESCILHVSIERFLYWAEIDVFKEGQDPVTLQQIIGEAAYRLSEDLRTKKQIQHSIIRHLHQFAMRPKTLAEKAATMKLGMLMLKIDSAQSVDERCVYLNEFIGRSECVFANAECLETIEQYWPLLDGSHVRLMIEYDNREPIGENIMEEDDVPDEQLKLRALILKTVDTLPAKDFHHLVTFTLDRFGKNFCRYEQPDMEEKVVELTNRLRNFVCPVQSGSTFSTTEIPSVQKLLFQSPHKFYTKLVRSLHDAFTANEQYVNAIVTIVLRHKSIAQHFMREHLESLLVDGFGFLHSPLLTQLVLKIYEVELFEPQDFIEHYYLKGIHKSFTKQNFAALCELLKLASVLWVPFISTIMKGKEAAVVQKNLVLKTAYCLSEVVGGLRSTIWQQNVPTDHVMIITSTIELLENTLKVLQKLTNNEDKQKLFRKIYKETPLSTQFYFQKHIYYIKEGLEAKPLSDTILEKERGIPEQGIAKNASTFICQTFAKIIYQDELNPSSGPDKIRDFLTRVLPQCTRVEAIALSQDDLLRNYIEPVAFSLLRDLFLTKTSHQGWLRTCISIYIHILMQGIPSTMNKQKPDVLGKLCEAVRSFLDLFELLPQNEREMLCEGLNDDFAGLYQHVYRINPEMPELAKLESFLNKRAPSSQSNFILEDALETMDVDNPEATLTAGAARRIECIDKLET